jgi:hypothetical protein
MRLDLADHRVRSLQFDRRRGCCRHSLFRVRLGQSERVGISPAHARGERRLGRVHHDAAGPQSRQGHVRSRENQSEMVRGDIERPRHGRAVAGVSSKRRWPNTRRSMATISARRSSIRNTAAASMPRSWAPSTRARCMRSAMKAASCPWSLPNRPGASRVGHRRARRHQHLVVSGRRRPRLHPRLLYELRRGRGALCGGRRTRAPEHGWLDGNDYMPHDAKVLEWGSGRTRLESAMIALG